MTQEDFIEKMQNEVFDSELQLTMKTSLKEIEEWDSLAFVSFVALANANGKSLNRDTIKGANTIHDLYEMMNG